MQALSVSRYNNYIKQIFDAEELLHNISIVGEVFGVSFSRQVIYFSLKDEESSISCVCFYNNLKDLIKEGDSIIVTGSPNYYQKAGKLSFNVVNVEAAGQGANYIKFLEMKDKLEKEGLFDESHKKSIPESIKRIGVITSKEGAVIRDIINIVTRRNPSIDIVLFPTKVQGKNAEDEIAYAIEKFSDYPNIDVIVVARGGGSLEDLWAYNTEKVARATYNCEKPIVSAVGHETDFTIIDFVSDLRAPTPSAAAELLTIDVSQRKKDLTNILKRYDQSINLFHLNNRDFLKRRVEQLSQNMTLIENQARNRFIKNLIRLDKQCEDLEKDSLYELSMLENSLNKLSPYEILKRGYAKVEQKGKVVDKVGDIMLSSDIEINFVDGKIIAQPKRVEDNK